jgi:hypothetical protein
VKMRGKRKLQPKRTLQMKRRRKLKEPRGNKLKAEKDSVYSKYIGLKRVPLCMVGKLMC